MWYLSAAVPAVTSLVVEKPKKAMRKRASSVKPKAAATAKKATDKAKAAKSAAKATAKSTTARRQPPKRLLPRLRQQLLRLLPRMRNKAVTAVITRPDRA